MKSLQISLGEWTSCGGIFDLVSQEKKLAELESHAADPEVWKDQDRAAELQKERSRLLRAIGQFRTLEKTILDAREVLDLAEADADIAKETDEQLRNAASAVEKLELQRMLSGE